MLPLLNVVVPAVLPTIGGFLSNRFMTVNVRSKCSFTLNRVEKSNQLYAEILLKLTFSPFRLPGVFCASGFAGLWLPSRAAPDITNRWHSLGCGALCTAFQLVAGISGPVLDVSFVRTGLNRMETVATKAVVQGLGHLLKVVYFGQMLTATN